MRICAISETQRNSSSPKCETRNSGWLNYIRWKLKNFNSTKTQYQKHDNNSHLFLVFPQFYVCIRLKRSNLLNEFFKQLSRRDRALFINYVNGGGFQLSHRSTFMWKNVKKIHISQYAIVQRILVLFLTFQWEHERTFFQQQQQYSTLADDWVSQKA